MESTYRQAGTTTVAAIVKDERPYLVEWTAWYRLLGFDRLILYSNDCSDGTDLLLDAMQDRGLVTHRRWPSIPERSAQVAAYVDAVATCDTEWILFVDADEFLHLNADADITSFLSRFSADVGAIALNWRIFGSSGHKTHGPEPVLERFTRAGPRGAHNERHCKTIARAEMLAEPHVHRTFLKTGFYVDAEGRPIEIERMGFTPTVEHRLAQINHYVVKSAEEFEAKKRRGNAHLPPEAPNRFTTREGRFFDLHDTNDEQDLRARDHLPALKAEMARIERLLGHAPRWRLGAWLGMRRAG